MATIPVTVTVTDKNGQQTQSVGGSVTPSGPASVNVGETTILPNKDSGAGNLLIAIPITLTSAGVINSLSIYIDGGSGSLQLALYSNVSGKPGVKIAETATFASAAGWNIHATTTIPSSPAGSYFLVFNYNSNTLVFRKASTGGTSYLSAATFGSMPATFPVNTTSTGSHWSLYGTFLEGSVPTIWVNSVAPGGVVPPGGGGGGGGGGFPASFQGNNNVTISAVDTSGGIVMSRTSGQTTAYAQFSASAITATGTSFPYEDLEFSWNLGYPGMQTLSNPSVYPYNGVTVNPNTSQTGPEAVGRYDVAGIYTITLNIRWRSGGTATNPVLSSTSVTGTFTVTSYNITGLEEWFDSAAPGGGNGTLANPYNDIAHLNTLLGTAGSFAHIKNNSAWSGTTGLGITASPMRIGTYGSGAAPTFTITGGTDPSLSLTNFTTSKSDVVVSGLDFICQNSPLGGGNPVAAWWIFAGSAQGGNPGFFLSDIYMDNCSLSTTGASGSQFMQYDGNSFTQTLNGGLWNCSIPCSQSSGSGYCIYNMPYKFGFVMGGSYSGRGNSDTLDHLIYPNIREHALFRYVNFGPGPVKNYCINTNYDAMGAEAQPQTAQYYLYSDCYFSGTHRGFDASNGNNSTAESIFKNFVAQLNAFTALDSDGAICLTNTALTLTLRDNKAWNLTGDRGIIPFASNNQFSAYRNKIYKPSSVSTGVDTGVFGLEFGTWNAMRYITDNQVEDVRATANVFEGTLTDIQTAGTVIDRNTWYTPNDANAWYNSGANISFATWQGFGFDANGLITNPGWPDPANGNF